MRKRGKTRLAVFMAMSILTAFCVLSVQPALSEIMRLRGQTVYVPAYSHIYHGTRQSPFFLTVTLSVRNTDVKNPITISCVDYYDTGGKLIKSYLKNELKLNPIGSVEYVILESEQSGGAGANFIVRWKSEQKVTEPVIETVMIGTSAQQGISFSSRGTAIEALE